MSTSRSIKFIILLLFINALVFGTNNSQKAWAKRLVSESSFQVTPILEVLSNFRGSSTQNIGNGILTPAVTAQIDFQGVAAQGDYVYIANTYSGLWVVDVSNPVSPTLVGTLTGLGGEANDLIVQGSSVYLADGPAGLFLIDISNPANPQLIGGVNTPGYAQEVVVQGHYAYVATAYPQYGLQIIDISDQAHPQGVGFFATGGYSYSVAISGNYAFVGNGIDGLYIIDISNPAAPAWVKGYSFHGYAHGMAIVRDYILIAWEDYVGLSGGLDVVNIFDPAQPTLAGRTYTPGRGLDIVLGGNYAYFADGPSGLRVIDVIDPAHPTPVDMFSTEGVANDLALIGDTLYLASREAGLYIFNLHLSSISGRIYDLRGNPASGVVVSDGPIVSRETDSAGRYAFDQLPSRNFTLTPSAAGFGFWPATRTVTIPPDAEYQDFILLPQPVSTQLTPGITTTLIFTDTQGLLTQIVIPAGAVSETVTVTLTPTVSPNGGGYAFTGHAFNLSVSQGNGFLPAFTFNLPVTATIHYSDADISVITIENALSFWWWNNPGWLEATQTCDPPGQYSRHLPENLITTPICQTGKFALYGPTQSSYLPVIQR